MYALHNLLMMLATLRPALRREWPGVAAVTILRKAALTIQDLALHCSRDGGRNLCGVAFF